MIQWFAGDDNLSKFSADITSRIKTLFHFRSAMSSIAFIFDIIFSCLITLFLLYRCGNYRKQHPITTITVFIAWFFSVLFVFILPLDISLVGSIILLMIDLCDLFRRGIEIVYDPVLHKEIHPEQLVLNRGHTLIYKCIKIYGM